MKLLTLILLFTFGTCFAQINGDFLHRKYRHGKYQHTSSHSTKNKVSETISGQIALHDTEKSGEAITGLHAPAAGEPADTKAPGWSGETSFNSFQAIAAANQKAISLLSQMRDSRSTASHSGSDLGGTLLYIAFLLISLLFAVLIMALWPAINPNIAFLLGMLLCIVIIIAIVLMISSNY